MDVLTLRRDLEAALKEISRLKEDGAKAGGAVARLEADHRSAMSDMITRHEVEKRRLEEALTAEGTARAAAEASLEGERTRADRDAHECRMLREEVREARGECDRLRAEVDKHKAEKQALAEKLRRVQSALG